MVTIFLVYLRHITNFLRPPSFFCLYPTFSLFRGAGLYFLLSVRGYLLVLTPPNPCENEHISLPRPPVLVSSFDLPVRFVLPPDPWFPLPRATPVLPLWRAAHSSPTGFGLSPPPPSGAPECDHSWPNRPFFVGQLYLGSDVKDRRLPPPLPSHSLPSF